MTLCYQFSWNTGQFAHNIKRTHSRNYKNRNSPIYTEFLSWKVSQGLLESIIKANREGKITTFPSQQYSKKMQDQMNSLLLKRKELKEDEVRKTWKSYILSCFDTDVLLSWVKCWWDRGCFTFLIGIYTASLPKCLWVSECDLFQTVNPAGILNLGELCILWSNSVTG